MEISQMSRECPGYVSRVYAVSSPVKTNIQQKNLSIATSCLLGTPLEDGFSALVAKGLHLCKNKKPRATNMVTKPPSAPPTIASMFLLCYRSGSEKTTTDIHN